MRQFFTNIDLSGNSVDNIVIANHAQDPPGIDINGFVYYNTTHNKLRVYTESGWEDLVSTPDGSILQVVNDPDFTHVEGRGDTIFLLNKGGNTFDFYLYVNNEFIPITKPISWEDVENRPNILDCSYIGSETIEFIYL